MSNRKMNIAGLRGRIIEVKTLTIIQAGISAVGLINGVSLQENVWAFGQDKKTLWPQLQVHPLDKMTDSKAVCHFNNILIANDQMIHLFNCYSLSSNIRL